MRTTGAIAAVLLLGGCPSGSLRCDRPFDVWVDEDGDRYGGEYIGLACEVADKQSRKPLDCDDADPNIHPESAEACDGFDNDCDGMPDDGLDLKQWYTDLDADGYGAAYPSMLACDRPDEGWVLKDGDCDDSDPDRNPDAPEVCGGFDEDCDGFEGDYDDSVDPDSFSTFYRDADGDGYGSPSLVEQFCNLQQGYSENNLDCNDANDLVARFKFYTDADDDGFGDPDTEVLACSPPANTVSNKLDCDDSAAEYNIDKSWFLDEDGDGYGSTVPVATQCTPPTPDAILDHEDCDDDDPNIHPGVEDPCLDGIDSDCNNSDGCKTCAEQFEADPESPSGVYDILPDGNLIYRVYCDMETDGGGWTMVASTNFYPLVDGGGPHHADLDSLNPNGVHQLIWDGLRDLLPGNSDIRFTCKGASSAPSMTVDLSFYDVGWYAELTRNSSDSSICFNQGDGVGADPPPARKNNLTDEELPAGDTWNANGYLEGEDYCSAYDDFTVDFDDRGLNGNENDGTDWGYDDYNPKCGTTLSFGQGQWFIFVR